MKARHQNTERKFLTLDFDAANMSIRAEAHEHVEEWERGKENILQDFSLVCFWQWKIFEMFLNLKRFRRITGTPLSILDNYSFRPTSEGQITCVCGEKRNQSVLKTESDA